MESMSMESMPIESACGGSPSASMAAGKPSQQISIENGRSVDGINPGAISAREANASSMMLAKGVRLRHLPELKRHLPLGFFRAGAIISAKTEQVERRLSFDRCPINM
jgi:hypothetical protein